MVEVAVNTVQLSVTLKLQVVISLDDTKASQSSAHSNLDGSCAGLW